MAIVAAPFIGLIADRLSRVTTVALCGLVGFVGYGLMYFIATPMSALIYVSAVLIGIAEIGSYCIRQTASRTILTILVTLGMIISSQVLIAQEAPPDARGNLSGFFGIFASYLTQLSCFVCPIVTQRFSTNQKDWNYFGD